MKVDPNYKYIKTTVVTVADVYPEGVEIPEGYEFVKFRPPEYGEPFIGRWRQVMEAIEAFPYPRIIVKKCPVRRVWKITELDGPRPINEGETCIATVDAKANFPRIHTASGPGYFHNNLGKYIPVKVELVEGK